MKTGRGCKKGARSEKKRSSVDNIFSGVRSWEREQVWARQNCDKNFMAAEVLWLASLIYVYYVYYSRGSPRKKYLSVNHDRCWPIFSLFLSSALQICHADLCFSFCFSLFLCLATWIFQWWDVSKWIALFFIAFSTFPHFLPHHLRLFLCIWRVYFFSRSYNLVLSVMTPRERNGQFLLFFLWVFYRFFFSSYCYVMLLLLLRHVIIAIPPLFLFLLNEIKTGLDIWSKYILIFYHFLRTTIKKCIANEWTIFSPSS